MLTHEAENGTNTPTLRARSRHASVCSLERYARQGSVLWIGLWVI